MDALPWFLAHGAVVWQAGLALLVAGGVGLAHLRPRAAARLAAIAARARLGRPLAPGAPFDDGALVTLRGTLEAQGGELSLRIGDASIALDGRLDVIAGSREVRRGRYLGEVPGDRDARLASSVDGDNAGGNGFDLVLRWLERGDVVRVSGVLHREAADDGRSYREPATRWTLRPAPPRAGELPVIVAAFDGAPRVLGPEPTSWAIGAVVGLASFVLLFGLAGEIAATMARSELAVLRFEGPPRGTACLRATTIALATPLVREHAIDELAEALDARRDADPLRIELRAAIHERRGDRAAAAAVWAAHGHEERGALLAEAAGAPMLAARAWYATGDFERAADAWDRASDRDRAASAVFGVEVNLLADRRDRAARAARELAAAYRDRPANSLELARWYESRAGLAICLATAINAGRGATTAAMAASQCASWASDAGCALLMADVSEGGERLARLSAVTEYGPRGHEVPRRWLHLLRVEAEPEHAEAPAPAYEVAASALATPGNALPLTVPGLERSLVEALARAPDTDAVMASRSRVAASAAAFAMMAGDHDGARRFARMHADAEAWMASRPHAERDRGARRRRAIELQALVEIAAGDLTRADELAAQAAHVGSDEAPSIEASASWLGLTGLFDYRRIGATDRLLDFLARLPPPDDDEKAAWSLAAAGDGAGLAAWLSRPRAEAGTFLRLGAPRIAMGRADLSRWLAWGYQPPGAEHPVAQLVHLANLAAAAEALGDADVAARRRAQAARFYKALLRRETAIPLAVLERF